MWFHQSHQVMGGCHLSLCAVCLECRTILYKYLCRFPDLTFHMLLHSLCYTWPYDFNIFSKAFFILMKLHATYSQAYKLILQETCSLRFSVVLTHSSYIVDPVQWPFLVFPSRLAHQFCFPLFLVSVLCTYLNLC